MNNKNRNRNDTIPVTIITGNLGSGKTKFLAQFLKQEKFRNAAVIINEFGEHSLDHLLIEKTTEEIYPLPNGCLCCSVYSELTEKMIELAESRDNNRLFFDNLIIETSGVTEVARLVSSLAENNNTANRYHLSHIIALVSAVEWQPETFSNGENVDQLAISDQVILTKLDLVSEHSRAKHQAQMTAALEQFAPHANIKAAPLSKEDIANTRSIHAIPSNKSKYVSSSTHNLSGVDALTLNLEKPIGKQILEQFLDKLLAQFPNRILRVKGLALTLENSTQPLLLQSVGSKISPSQWLADWTTNPQTNITVIFKEQNADEIHALFNGFANVANIDQADNLALTQNPLSITGLGRFKP